MAKITQSLLIALLAVEALAAVWPLSEAILVKNRLAAWPWSAHAQKSADLLITQPGLIRQEIIAWEKVAAETAETRNGLLQLAYLSWQIYEDDRAKLFWERAFYLDPGLVASLPLQLF